MRGIVSGQRPDITPAQILATLVAGVPIISNLLHAFGVFDLSHVQQDALTNTLNWGVPFAGLLLAGDTGLRAARNAREAHVEAAAMFNDQDRSAAAINPGDIVDIKKPEDGDLGSEVKEDEFSGPHRGMPPGMDPESAA